MSGFIHHPGRDLTTGVADAGGVGGHRSGRARNRFSVLRMPFAALAGAVRRSCAGQAIVEYAIVFPLQLMLTLAIIQLAHLFVAKHVIEYGAFCGARAALVGLSDDDARLAAALPISTISGAAADRTSEPLTVPGWGPLPGSRGALERTGGMWGEFRITRDTEPGSGGPIVVCNLTHWYKLVVPVGNTIVYRLGDAVVGLENLERVGSASYFQMKASCTLAQPWANP